MTDRHRLWPALPVAALVLLLAGCASPVATPTSAPSRSASAAPAPTPVPSTSSSTLPAVRLQLSCADLFSASLAEQIVGDPAVQLRRDGTSALQGLQDVAMRQSGTLACIWGGKNQTDSGYDDGLTVYAAVDAAAQYATNVPGLEAQNPPTASNTAGTKSEYQCDIAGDGYYCSANMLVGTTWVSAYLQNEAGPTITQTAASGRMQQALSGIAKTISAAPKELPAWTGSSAPAPAYCDASASTGQVRSTFSDSGLALAPADASADYSDAHLAGSSVNTPVTCEWLDKSGRFVSVSVLKSGAWAFPGLLAHLPTAEYVGKYAPVSISGADSALYACGAQECDFLLAVGSNAIDIWFDDQGTAKDKAAVTSLLADIKAT
jgi:hypothetical protein